MLRMHCQLHSPNSARRKRSYLRPIITSIGAQINTPRIYTDEYTIRMIGINHYTVNIVYIENPVPCTSPISAPGKTLVARNEYNIWIVGSYSDSTYVGTHLISKSNFGPRGSTVGTLEKSISRIAITTIM